MAETMMVLMSVGVSVSYLLRYIRTQNATHLTPVLSWFVLAGAYIVFLIADIAVPDRAYAIRTIVFIIGLSEIIRNILLLRYGKHDRN